MGREDLEPGFAKGYGAPSLRPNDVRPVFEGDRVTLRSSGVLRYVGATFLVVWLAGWAVGEAIALGVLTSMLLALAGLFLDSRWTELGRSTLDMQAGFGFIFVFLLVWVMFWTVGGLAAMWQFLRLVGGSDRLTMAPGGLELSRRAGPIRRTRQFDAADVRRIRIRSSDKALVVDTRSGTTVLSDLGSVAERDSLCSLLRSRLRTDGTPATAVDPTVPPPGWQLERDSTGAIRLARPTRGRRTGGAIMGAITIIVAYGSISPFSDSNAGSVVSLLVISALAFASAWLSWAREEWSVRPGRLQYHLQFGPFHKQRTFENAQLEVTTTTDSDGDRTYRLIVRQDAMQRRIASALHDDAELLDCARWLEAATGFSLKVH